MYAPSYAFNQGPNTAPPGFNPNTGAPAPAPPLAPQHQQQPQQHMMYNSSQQYAAPPHQSPYAGGPPNPNMNPNMAMPSNGNGSGSGSGSGGGGGSGGSSGSGPMMQNGGMAHMAAANNGAGMLYNPLPLPFYDLPAHLPTSFSTSSKSACSSCHLPPRAAQALARWPFCRAHHIQ
jgi:hypothetical protein